MKILLGIVLLAFGVLGFYYLANPQLWNFRAVNSSNSNPIAPSRTNLEIQSSAIFNRNTPIPREVNDQFTCSLPVTREIGLVPETRIYRWVDENGQAHFSDIPPSQIDYEIMDLDSAGEYQYFRLAVQFRGDSYVPFLESNVTPQINAIYEIFSGWLGRQRLRQVDLNVLIFQDRANYLQYANASTRNNMSETGGYYSSSTNEAVTYKYPDNERTLSVVRHESTHVMVRGMLGMAPVWLNEGLADYFENISVNDQAKRISINQNSLNIARGSLSSGYPTRLSDFLMLSDQDWRQNNREIHYALSWSFVYFLAGTREGQQSLALIMRTLADNYCMAINSVELLNSSYSGGFNRLQQDYVDWLFGNSQQGHAY